uniref:Uncharacterized protein n=1 Tax=Glossina austeni TaxID=7395 RepID=A0A1A9VDS3_GLOAU
MRYLFNHETEHIFMARILLTSSITFLELIATPELFGDGKTHHIQGIRLRVFSGLFRTGPGIYATRYLDFKSMSLSNLLALWALSEHSYILLLLSFIRHCSAHCGFINNGKRASQAATIIGSYNLHAITPAAKVRCIMCKSKRNPPGKAKELEPLITIDS